MRRVTGNTFKNLTIKTSDLYRWLKLVETNSWERLLAFRTAAHQARSFGWSMRNWAGWNTRSVEFLVAVDAVEGTTHRPSQRAIFSQLGAWTKRDVRVAEFQFAAPLDPNSNNLSHLAGNIDYSLWIFELITMEIFNRAYALFCLLKCPAARKISWSN